MGAKKIYTESFKCHECKEVIGEYSKSNKERVVKSYYVICFQCYNKLYEAIDK